MQYVKNFDSKHNIKISQTPGFRGFAFFTNKKIPEKMDKKDDSEYDNSEFMNALRERIATTSKSFGEMEKEMKKETDAIIAKILAEMRAQK